VSNSSFTSKVNEIVVEFGNGLYQDVMDRYISGEDVSPAELSQAWRNTTQIIVWDSPVYERLFATVRKVNQDLPKDKHLRVLLGDAPIDWNSTHSFSDWGHWLSRRDEYFAATVQRDVLSKHHKALLIIGGAHLV
jgi:hypothetical protein